ncbi:MAG TPA: DUF1343 domain-containing protein [Vicinamibacteria bacterium]|nr:DUF1343 domain-containing protein [Vicinamibacteria bacterium]
MNRIAAWAASVAGLSLGACGARAAPPPPPPGGAAAVVSVGLERVETDRGGALRAKRLGLVVHGASVAADGRHAVDVLRGLGLDVVRLFSPEHGLRGRAGAGIKVADGRDPGSGLPVVSLYGEKTKPAPADLAGLDALVFDLQDAGVRFYTYSSTMLLCLEAAAEAGIELVVLDRPNPLGGERVEGPHRDAPEVVPLSLVSRAPGPLVHGLTFGEMARFVNARRASPARLSVVAMRGWRRSMTWVDTGRPWVNPSPNLRSPEAALAYPGTALLEATNATEGRGTEAPFLLLGAPWFPSARLASSLAAPGFVLEPVTFTPRASEAAPDPKHRDLACAGVRVRVREAAAARPYALGVALLHALRREPAFGWRREGALDWLVGTRRLREALERGDSVEAIVDADAAAIEAYRRERAPALLY